MSNDRDNLTTRFVALTEQMYDDLRSRPPEEWSDLEFTMPQFRVLLLLRKGEQRMGYLAACLGVTLPSTTSIVDRLVAKGLVERTHDDQDRRVVTCRLSDVGRNEIERFWRIGRSRAERLAGLMDEDQLAHVVEAMEVMAAAVREYRGLDADSDGAGTARAQG